MPVRNDCLHAGLTLFHELELGLYSRKVIQAILTLSIFIILFFERGTLIEQRLRFWREAGAI